MILTALKGMSLERSAVAVVALTGVRPSEARGLRWEEWDRAKQHIHVHRAVWHKHIGSTKTQQSERFIAVTDELRDILLDLWNARHCPLGGYILAGLARVSLSFWTTSPNAQYRPALEKAKIEWPEWYALRRFLGTQVRMQADSETASKALGNSKEIFDKHYNKPTEVLPDVRRAVKSAISGLIS